MRQAQRQRRSATGCSVSAEPERSSLVYSSQKDFGGDVHARPELPIVILSGLDDDFGGDPLHDLDVIAGGVLRRKQTEQGTCCSSDAVDVSLVGSAGGVDVDLHMLPRVDTPKLRFLEVRS